MADILPNSLGFYEFEKFPIHPKSVDSLPASSWPAVIHNAKVSPKVPEGIAPAKFSKNRENIPEPPEGNLVINLVIAPKFPNVD